MRKNPLFYWNNWRTRRELKFDGYDAADRFPSGQVEKLPDAELQRLNALLPWTCFTVDSKGRRFGSIAWAGKRGVAQKIPDDRIVRLDRLVDLSDKTVLELGCFEGVHTAALCARSRAVHAVDARIENVVKTLVRSNLLGFKPTVTVCDVDNPDEVAELPAVDVLHHVGVLYHLRDPIGHLARLFSKVGQAVLLDTHYATDAMAQSTLQWNDRSYRYHRYGEGGRNEVFSGMYDHAKWLLLDDIRGLLIEAGFTDIRIAADEVQRNGPRVTLYAAKPSVMVAAEAAPASSR